MAWVQRKPRNRNTIYALFLKKLYFVSFIYFASRIIRESCQYLHLMAAANKLLSKGKTHKKVGFGLKIMSDEKYSHFVNGLSFPHNETDICCSTAAYIECGDSSGIWHLIIARCARNLFISIQQLPHARCTNGMATADKAARSVDRQFAALFYYTFFYRFP